MYKITLISSFFFLMSLTSFSQMNTATEDSIKNTINTFFKGMQEKDTTLIRTLLTPGIMMQTIARNKEKEVIIRTEKVEDWFTQIMTLPDNIKKIEEKIVFEKILIDDAMAIAWTPFELYLNDEYYSCGVNQFQLVKLKNTWKINFIIDTRRKTCK